MKKALVALPDQAWDIIDRELNGKLGSGHSDIVRAIVLAYLSEKGYMDKGGKSHVNPRDTRTLGHDSMGV